MRKLNWQIGSNGYAVIKNKQISKLREVKQSQEIKRLKPYLILKYNITDIENPTKLVNSLNYIVEMIIDGLIVEPVTEFTFDSLGEHEVWFKYEESALKDSYGMIGEFGSMEALTEIVKIPANLLAFRSSAFYNCSNLRKINLKTYAGSLQKLSSVLFLECINLEEIIWANTITTLEYGVFYNTNKLKELYLPNSITTIINPALTYMHGLEKIVFSEGMDTIPYLMCAYCENLKEIVLPKNIKIIGLSAFSGCGFEKLNLSNSKIEKIEYGAFSSCSKLKEVILSNTVREVQGYAFGSCSNIEKVKLSEAMTEITSGNWQTSSLKEIDIPKGITIIKSYAFLGCSGLEKLDLSNSSIVTIEQTAFSACTGLKEVIFPDTLSILESGAFGGSYNIERVVFSKSLSIINPSNWGGNSKLKEVIIPEGVTTIGGGAFGGCFSLEIIKLPNTITVIEDTAFSSCQSLKEIKIPNSVTTIGKSAFGGCTGINYIHVPKTVENLGEGAFSGINYVDIDNENTRIKTINNVFIDSMTNTLLGVVNLNEEIIIPEVVKIIGSNSLACNNNTLIIPDNVIEIKQGALGTIETLIIGEGITNIPNRCFSSKVLKHVVLGSNIKSIGSRAFCNYDNTSAIETITCKAVEAPTIDNYTFYYINTEGVLKVPDKTKYSSWMSTSSYYLGKYNWTIENIE